MVDQDRRTSIGVVVIGRNEGDRLRRCLGSLVNRAATVVYVDSGSTDGSVAMAREMGVEVVDLDLSTPFTAARARNAGSERLSQIDPSLAYLQFVDGDCEIVDGYLESAAQALADHADLAAVAGRLRERSPEASIYNRLCDMEWNTPVGDAAAVGGVSMFRRSAFDQVGGFDPTLIAGEEPELCVRLRLEGWKIRRIDHDMGWHDAAMTRFGQWWRRAVRGGYAALEGAVMHGRGPTRHKVAEVRRTLMWALALPLIAVGCVVLAILATPWAWVGMAAVAGLYGLWAVRMLRRHRADSTQGGVAIMAVTFAMIARFAYLFGFCRYIVTRCLRRGPRLIEYKDVSPVEDPGAGDAGGAQQRGPAPTDGTRQNPHHQGDTA